ncbi:MAG: hypothetical protein FWG88_04715 [Oscillospiraceae bacterium]|nr:hypothetical protein [Oscillospiraceae bacterium]
MQINIVIDKLTPCLVEIETGAVHQTSFSVAKDEELHNLQSLGWNFDWADVDLAYCNIYKLQIEGDEEVQGLVAAEVVRGAVYIHLAESAPHNLPPNKKYDGVGGHLFAIAIKLSLAMGFGGYVYFEAKNLELVEHYTNSFGARLLRTRIHEYRMEIDEECAQ